MHIRNHCGVLARQRQPNLVITIPINQLLIALNARESHIPKRGHRVEIDLIRNVLIATHIIVHDHLDASEQSQDSKEFEQVADKLKVGDDTHAIF